jgi:aspartate racemase
VVEHARTIPRLRRIGLLATRGTIHARIYHNAFAPHSIDVLIPEDWELDDLQSIIGRLKGGDKNVYAIQKMAEALVARNIQALILGCTELSLIASNLQLSVPIIDSTEVLARRAVRIALGGNS